MIPELDHIFDNEDINKFEARMELIKDSSLTTADKEVYTGKYPLLPFRDEMRGTFGGEFVSQGILAAWATVKDPEFTPHSLHSYFIKNGVIESSTRWEITHISDGRNFSNRLAKAYQVHTNELVYTIQISFVRNNDSKKRDEIYQQQIAQGDAKIRSIPIQFSTKPGWTYDKYKDQVDDLPLFEHTHGHLQHVFPPEFFPAKDSLDLNAVGNHTFGFFCRFTDELALAKNPIKTKYAQIGLLSDAVILATIVNAIGLSLPEEKKLFRVSLDQTVYFHDFHFDPNQWLYLEYSFSTLGNDRTLVNCRFYTIEGKLFCSIIQEGLLFLDKKMVDHAKAAHENFHKQNKTESARL
ncbi:thioesterase-like superfamily-domain-containing protein [Scheffersomyces coipomensis]|uniref:thioesterase-like superfamily-domain-containing protein n=1 Tax=Scheffersomyces coipomensis TaxID=1788519 RepID=UPI00315C809F